MRVKFAALAACLLFLSSPASAQTPSQTSAQTIPPTSAPAAASTTPIDNVAVSIWPMSTVALPDMQPTETSFALGAIEGIDPKLLSGVTAKGYARKVAVEDQTIGQILVVSVAKGDREETISTEGFQAQFDAKDTTQLFPEKTVEATGSKAALIAALERLAAPKTETGDKPAARDEVSQNPTSAGGSSNDEAASYRSPSVTAAPTETEAEPVVDYRTTNADCPVRVDQAQGVAFQQSKIQTFTDGALSNDGECTDSNVSYPLKKSYLSCPVDVVDLAAMQAWPQFSLYYTDDAGETHSVGECGQDTETVYTITEDEDQCPISLDYQAGKAIPQAALVYINRNNALVQARGCEISTVSAALTMTESAGNCSLRHDFTAGQSYELSMWTYVRNGVTYQAAPCADTGRSFAHEKVYADDAGAYVCPPVTNMTTKTVTLQSRKRISVDGVKQFISECTPDTASQAILSTTDGCMDPSKWTHDLDAGVSYGQERFWYPKANGDREYVTACQTSAVTYAHSHSITGYQNHDDQLYAYPLTTVTISVNGSPYTIASSEVLPGAAQFTYLPEGVTDQPTGQSSYNPGDDCNAYRETAKYETWTRPDQTLYLKLVGTGTPTGPVNVCISTVIDSRNMQTGFATTGNTCWELNDGTHCSWTDTNIYQTVNKVQKKNAETGVIAAQTCEFANADWNGWSITQQGTYHGINANHHPAQSPHQTLFIPPCPF